MGALLSGSGEFAIEVGGMHVNLALASLGIMEEELCFNICQLESSYMWNSEVEDLDLRVKWQISVYLSYACRFWVDHAKDVKNGESLAKKIKTFFKEKFLFWMEALTLLKSLNNAPAALIGIIQWMEGILLEISAILANPLKWHTSGVSSVAFSPDGKRIASGSSDNTICLWDGETGLQLASPLKGHTSVSSVAFSPDGKRIASGSKDKTICLWDAETGLQLVSPLKGHTSGVSSVAFSPDGKRIASGSSDNTICLWDGETGVQLASPLKGHTSSVTSVAFSPDGKRIVSGAWDNTICLWDADTGVQLASPLKGHTHWVTSVAFSPDGKRIASGSSDNTICLWDAETGLQLASPLKGHTEHVNSVTFSPDGKRIASGSWDNTICLWDAEIGLQLASALKWHTEHVNSHQMERGLYQVLGTTPYVCGMLTLECSWPVLSKGTPPVFPQLHSCQI
ncbi:hypothetical protein ID866_9350 [Astraeus odoratus]|nr:hypothetical protein ID866_9350 [Astraeus odoratus]